MLLLKLLLAHVLGDFALQPQSWVNDKEKKKLRSKYLYIHVGVHALLLLIVLGFQQKYFIIIAVVSLSHGVIDAIKLLKPLKNKRILFFLDQLAHLFVIGGVVCVLTSFKLKAGTIINEKNILFILAILVLTSVSSIVLKVVFSTWHKDIEDISKKDSSLKHAGKYIGMLERLFVFVFIILNQWQAIGFLLAAKSVFRFGDLSKAKNRQLTEYILIGTLLSFGIAILTGILYLKLIAIL